MTETVLSVEEHFETLRESVWTRFCARHRGSDRERFDDLYAEWWTRELERSAKGSPSRAATPAAFIAEAVHHVLIDEARARARGLSRSAKGSLELVDIDDQHAAAGADDTAATATYEALVHRVLSLVQGRLTDRETRVFVWTYLYLEPSEAAASALGLSVPRLKKDRRKIAGKVGAEVWEVISGELDLCAVYDEKSLPAVFEILTMHVEDCAVCSGALGSVRQSALAVLSPEMLLLGTTGAEGVTHGLSDLFGRLGLWVHRGTDMLSAMPPQGRTAAVVAVAATAVAGGAATVPNVVGPRDSAGHHKRTAERPTAKRAAVVATATPVKTALPSTPTASPKEAPAPHRHRPEPTATPAPTATPREEFTSVEATPAPVVTAAPVPASAAAEPSSSAGSPADAGEEFGLEAP